MAIFDTHFYNKTIHLYTSIFGSIFNEVQIKRTDGTLIKVPLAYAGQQKENVRNDENPDPNAVRYKMRLPRLSFLLTGWERDPMRSTNRLHRLQDVTTDRSGVKEVHTQYNRVPYNFSYQLNAKTKNLDDMLQIVEQILVYFNPDLKVVVKDNPNINAETAVDIILQDSSLNDQFEGAFEDGRIIEYTFDFVLQGYLYMPTDSTGIIKTININYYDLLNPDTLLDSDTIS